VVAEFGVCLSTLITLEPSTPPPRGTTTTSATSKSQLPSWVIALIVFGIIALILLCILLWRRKNKKKRAAKMEQFKEKRGLGGFLHQIWRHRKKKEVAAGSPRKKKGVAVDSLRRQEVAVAVAVTVAADPTAPPPLPSQLSSSPLHLPASIAMPGSYPGNVNHNPAYVSLPRHTTRPSSSHSAESFYSSRHSSLDIDRPAPVPVASTSFSPPRKGDRRVVLIEYSRPSFEAEEEERRQPEASPSHPPPYSGSGQGGEFHQGKKGNGDEASYPPSSMERYYTDRKSFEWQGRNV
jgi:hypothetical protein